MSYEKQNGRRLVRLSFAKAGRGALKNSLQNFTKLPNPMSNEERYIQYTKLFGGFALFLMLVAIWLKL